MQLNCTVKAPKLNALDQLPVHLIAAFCTHIQHAPCQKFRGGSEKGLQFVTCIDFKKHAEEK